ELLSGVDAEKIDSCLYYLEFHTQVQNAPVLVRLENAAKLRQIKFEQGFQQLINDPVLGPLSKRLAEVFCSTSDFRLNEKQAVIIDAVELATHLNWELTTLENEVKNLARKHIIAFASPVYIKWNRNRADSSAIVTQLMKD